MATTTLLEPRTWYVDNVNGSDNNDGSSQAQAFRTIACGVAWLCDRYDFAAQPTLQLLPGADYREKVVLPRYRGSLAWRGPGNYTYPRIVGVANNNAAVKVVPPDLPIGGGKFAYGSPFMSVNGSPWILESLTVSTPDNFGIVADAYGHIYGRRLNFALCGEGHIAACYRGFYEHIDGQVKVSGSAKGHFNVVFGGMIMAQQNVMVLQGNPQFIKFGFGSSGGICNYSQLQFSGTCAAVGVLNDGTAILKSPASGWPDSSRT